MAKNSKDKKTTGRRDFLGTISAFVFGILAFFDNKEEKIIGAEIKAPSSLEIPPSIKEKEKKNNDCEKPIK